jgi:hypothetical protein
MRPVSSVTAASGGEPATLGVATLRAHSAAATSGRPPIGQWPGEVPFGASWAGFCPGSPEPLHPEVLLLDELEAPVPALPAAAPSFGPVALVGPEAGA